MRYVINLILYNMDLKEVVIDAFKYIGKKEIHVNDLARYIHDFVSEYNEMDVEELKAKISNRLSRDVVSKGKESTFVKVSNGKKGVKRGVYSLRPNREDPKPIKPDLPLELFKGSDGKIKHEDPENPPKRVFDGLSTMQIGKGVSSLWLASYY